MPTPQRREPARAPSFLPYLGGARTPHNDAHARGVLRVIQRTLASRIDSKLRRRMSTPTLRPSASAAAARLGVSVEALRFHEPHGLVAPARMSAGYRAVRPFTRARQPAAVG